MLRWLSSKQSLLVVERRLHSQMVVSAISCSDLSFLGQLGFNLAQSMVQNSNFKLPNPKCFPEYLYDTLKRFVAKR
jgi:hypothetical protein